ncbi:hypothetical protein PV325_012600 [Microctonus aethiopoides]|nr:hypothetical protein PV325_012600 [Microctonus aethiopoides]
MQSPTSGDAQKSNASKFTSFKVGRWLGDPDPSYLVRILTSYDVFFVASSKEYGTEYAWWCSGIDTGGASPCIIFLALLVANDPSVVNGVVSGDARCVVLQRRSRINEGGPGELGSPYTGASCLRGFSAGEVLGAMRQRRRERQWHREDLQAFEEDLRLPIGAEEEDFDFLGIRWMQNGR